MEAHLWHSYSYADVHINLISNLGSLSPDLSDVFNPFFFSSQSCMCTLITNSQRRVRSWMLLGLFNLFSCYVLQAFSFLIIFYFLPSFGCFWVLQVLSKFLSSCFFAFLHFFSVRFRAAYCCNQINLPIFGSEFCICQLGIKDFESWQLSRPLDIQSSFRKSIRF